MLTTQELKQVLKLVDKWLIYKRYIQEIPGLAVGIFYNNDVVFNKPYGYANVTNKVLLTNDHLHRIASQSKPFVAVLVQKLAEQGKLNLDDPVNKYTNLGNLPDTITIRTLLVHTSGVIRDGDSNYVNDDNYPTLEDLATLQLKVYEPGAHWKYSNIGYILLGEVIKKITGLSFSDAMQKLLFDPLGLADSYTDYSPQLNLATGYGRNIPGAGRESFVNTAVNAFESCSGICTNTLDLLRFYKVFLGAYPEYLTEHSISELLKIQFREKHYTWCLGLEQFSFGTKTYFGHRGTFAGYNGITVISTDTGLIVTVLANAIDAPVVTFVANILSLVDYFVTNYERELTLKSNAFAANLDTLEGFYTSRWGTDIFVNVNNNLVSLNAELKDPVDDLNIYKQLDAKRFVIPNKEHFSKIGELLEFDKDVVSYNGFIASRTNVPEGQL